MAGVQGGGGSLALSGGVAGWWVRCYCHHPSPPSSSPPASLSHPTTISSHRCHPAPCHHPVLSLSYPPPPHLIPPLSSSPAAVPFHHQPCPTSHPNLPHRLSPAPAMGGDRGTSLRSPVCLPPPLPRVSCPPPMAPGSATWGPVPTMILPFISLSFGEQVGWDKNYMSPPWPEACPHLCPCRAGGAGTAPRASGASKLP